MKLSNQNICNLQGFKNFWGQCQMPLGGESFLGVSTPPPPPPENPYLDVGHFLLDGHGDLRNCFL